MVKQSKIFEVYEIEKKRGKALLTRNLTPGKIVYDEKLINEDRIEYREWNASKSKLAAAILKGCQNIFIRKGTVVLYLGCASGTTVSHISDIVWKEGFIFALDFAPRVLREIVFVAEERKNIAPILADANKPESYADKISLVDVIYQDIAQKNQVEVFLKNIKMFLKKEGYAILAVKARSIDVTKNPKSIFSEVRKELEKELIIVDYRELSPFQKDHCMFITKFKQ